MAVSPNPNDFHVMVNPRSQTAESVAKWINDKMANGTDPASRTPGAPPMYGEDAVPHLMTFQSIVGSFSRAYVNPDEAMRDSIDNAHLMEKDVGLLESVECRQRLTALLDWEIVPEDEKCQYQVSLAQELQRIVGRIRNFTKYRMWLMKAIWAGRSGIQHKYGYTRVNGSMRLMPTPLHRDHNGWMPINGDKLIFRYEDGLHNSDPGAYPHQMGIKVGVNPGGGKLRLHRDYKTEPVADGLAVFLKPYERDTFCVHKHMIEDADFHHSYFAGSIHGVGIRSKIYWEWFLKQEAFAFLMQYLERSAGGIEVWTYPMGDPKALEATKKAAMEKMANGRNIVFFPKPMGDDSDAYKFEVIEPGAMGLDIMQGIIENYFGGRLKRYILGQELSTEAKATGMGSGVAEAHMDTLSQIVNFDARNLEETLTHELVRYIQQLNFPETLGWHMRMSLKTEDDKTQERMEALNSAYQMGARIAEGEVFKTLGLSAPTSGEKILSLQSQQPAMPGMPGMPPDGGIPDGDNSGAAGIPDDGIFPDQENEQDQETDEDGEPDTMELIRSMLDQYARKMEHDRYATQITFNWDEDLHPRETETDTVHKAGQFTSKKKPQQQQTLFGSPAPPKRQSGRFSGKPRSKRAELNDKIRGLFAEHASSKQNQLNFDEPINTPTEQPSPTESRQNVGQSVGENQQAKHPVSIATEKPPLEEMSRIAAGYQLHGMRAEPEDDRLARQHQKHMTKSALDNWLMKKFDIDAFTARGVSNAAGEMNPYTVDGSGTVGGTNVRWTHKSKEPSIEELGDVPWTQQAPTPQPQPVTQSQQTPPTADIPSQPEASPNADMPTKPARRRMMGASADSMKAVAQPAAAPVAPKPQQTAQVPQKSGSHIGKTVTFNDGGSGKIIGETASQWKVAIDGGRLKSDGTPLDVWTFMKGSEKQLNTPNRWMNFGARGTESTDEKADPPSVEPDLGTANQPAPAAQSGAAPKSAQGISETPVQSSENEKPVNPNALTPEQQDLITDHYEDHMKNVTRLASEKFAGYKRKDREAFDSAIIDGLTRAAQLWDGQQDFPAFAQRWAFINLKNLNPNRRKLNTITQSGSADDESDPMANIQSRESDSGYGDDEKENLNKAIASLPSNQDQWLVRAWFTGEDEDGNTLNQSQVADQFNSRFGKTLTRQALGARATKLITQLRDTLVDPDQYAAVRNMVIRYYRNEILTMQKERYERRQERVIREAAEYTETDPTDAQIRAGNYKKGRFTWNGMPIVIENPRGSTRRGVSSSGEIWRREMTAHYGYISGTEGTDGDQVDVFMGKHPESELVFVVHQIDQSTGQFDELKVILGETNLKKAKELYLSNYSKGWKCGEIESMTISQFKAMLESGECC